MMIPDEAVIPEEKLTKYLLLPRPRNDKARFLKQAGFTQDNPGDLRAALRRRATGTEGVEDGKNEYGAFYRVEGNSSVPVVAPCP